jgi:ParB/RepB/Spo0J family partition protein
MKKGKQQQQPYKRFDVGGLPMIVLPIDLPEDNPENPNEMSPEFFEKEKESIKTYGMIDPPAVRELPDGRFMIVDGHHRRRAAKELGHETITCVDLSRMSDHDARKFMLIANELRGRAEPVKLAEVVATLTAAEPIENLISTLPFSAQEIESMVKSIEPFDWSPVGIEEPARGGGSEGNGGYEQDRVFRLGSIHAHIPVRLHDDLMIEWRKSVEAVSTRNAEIVLRDILKRLRACPPERKEEEPHDDHDHENAGN